MAYIIGQVLGVIASIGCLIGPFFKKKWMMLVNMMVANLLVALNFLLIGQVGSAIFLNMVAIIQGFVSLYHVIKETKVTFFEKVLFIILYLIFGIIGVITAPGFVWELSAKNLIEIMPIIGALILSVSVFIRDEQKTRMVGLSNCIVWFIYDAIVMSSSILAQLFGIISTVSAMYKYRKKK